MARDSTRGRSPIQVEVHGLGATSKFDADRLCQWLVGVVSRAQQEGEPRVLLILPDHQACRGREALRILHTLLVAGYRFDRYQRERPGSGLKTLWVAPPNGEEGNYSRAMGLARAVAKAGMWTRDLGNTPPNEANPSWMAAQAEAMAGRFGLSCDVLEVSDLEEKGMGGILAVGQGSTQEPRLVQLSGGSGERLVALVGKGVTFDTGGISIKPSSGMEEMKYDKAGACAVLGIVQAIAELELPIRFQAFLPLVENMPGGGSYRPGDIIRCYNGKTVEIVPGVCPLRTRSTPWSSRSGTKLARMSTRPCSESESWEPLV